MLKNLMIFALSLVVFGMKGYSHTYKAEEGKEGNQPSLTTSIVTAKEIHGPDFQHASKKDEGTDVRVISTPEKDAYDKASVWINGILAIIGLAGVGIAVFTLNKIRDQVGLMARQTDAMERQNTAARNRDRARLVVVHPPPDPDFSPTNRVVSWDENSRFLRLSIEVVNDGPMKAYEVQAFGLVSISDSREVEISPKNYYSLVVPEIIGPVPEVSPTRISMVPFGDILGVSPTIIANIQGGRQFLRLVGDIRYTDHFGESCNTPFNFLWNAEGTTTSGFYANDAQWSDDSPPPT
jgi:hypothetical protein